MIVLEQIIILMVLLLVGVAATIFLFWLLFKKDAPSYDEIKETFLVDFSE